MKRMGKSETVVLKFNGPLDQKQEKQLTDEYEGLLKGICGGLMEAEHKTNGTLKQSVYSGIRSKLRIYIMLTRPELATYEIRIKSDVLKALDVNVPVNGSITKAESIARKISKTFMQNTPHETKCRIKVRRK